MFGKVADFFKGKMQGDSLISDKSGKAVEKDLHIACAVLLVEMAGADSDIAPEEAEIVCKQLMEHMHIEEEELPELVEVAVASRKEKGRIDEFVKMINENFGDNQRIKILSMIWGVVLADGVIDKFEERFALQMQNRLKLTPEQAEKAKSSISM